MQQLDQVIQQNASAAEEMSTGADELSSQAESLQEAISFFKINGTREHGRRPPVTSRKKGPQQRTISAPSARKPRSADDTAADLEINLDPHFGDLRDKDFTLYQ
jgi:methyl-accepting chemotaxis protein